MKTIRKIEPLVENVIIGLLFIGIGFYIIDSFNNFYEIIGFLSICLCGFKVFIGLIIYGIALWAIIFKPESFIQVKQNRIVERVLNRSQKDIKLKNLQRAKDRLHGLISKYPNNQKVRFELAHLYLIDKDYINAGRYLYFKNQPNDRELYSIEQFENSVGNNSFQILRKISKPSKIDTEFMQEFKTKFNVLIDNIQVESEKNSWIVNEVQYYLQIVNIPFYKKILRNQKDILIHSVVLIVLLCVTEILKR